MSWLHPVSLKLLSAGAFLIHLLWRRRASTRGARIASATGCGIGAS